MRMPAIAFLCLPLASCTSTYVEKVADADKITLQDAVLDVAHTMDALAADRVGKAKVGMYLDNVTVTFNVSAKRTTSENGKLALSGLPVMTTGTLGASTEATLASEGTRGNQITLVFKNQALVKGGKPPDVLFGVKLSPQEKEAFKQYMALPPAERQKELAEWESTLRKKREAAPK